MSEVIALYGSEYPAQHRVMSERYGEWVGRDGAPTMDDGAGEQGATCTVIPGACGTVGCPFNSHHVTGVDPRWECRRPVPELAA